MAVWVAFRKHVLHLPSDIKKQYSAKQEISSKIQMYLNSSSWWRNDWLELLSHFTQWYQGKIFQNFSHWIFFYSSHIHRRKRNHNTVKVNLHAYIQSELPQRNKNIFLYFLGIYLLEEKRSCSCYTEYSCLLYLEDNGG